MAELSIPWPEQNPAVNDGKQYTDTEFAAIWRALFGKTAADNEGVLPGALNDLVVTAPAANTIRVNTGAAVVYGRVYINDASLDLTPASAGAGTTRKDYCVVQADWTGGVGDQFAVRAAILEGTAGALPSLTHTPGSLWQIPLASYVINDAGAISALTITGVREWAHFNTMVSSAMLDALCVTESKIGALAVTEGKVGTAAVTNTKLGAGAVTPDKATLYSVGAFCFFLGGTLSVGVNPTGDKYILDGTEIFTGWDMVASTGPTGAAYIVDINLEGVAIFAGGSRPQIAAGQTKGAGGAPATTGGADGNVLSIDLDQIGSTIAGADVKVMLWYKKPLV